MSTQVPEVKKQQQRLSKSMWGFYTIKVGNFGKSSREKKQQNGSAHENFVFLYCTRKLSLLFEMLLK